MKKEPVSQPVRDHFIPVPGARPDGRCNEIFYSIFLGHEIFRGFLRGHEIILENARGYEIFFRQSGVMKFIQPLILEHQIVF